MEDISFYIHENTLCRFNSFLRESNENLLKEICLFKNYDEQKLINEILPPVEMNRRRINKSDITDKERCMARLWKGGYGGRCCNVRKNLGTNNEKEFCNTHQKEIDKNGKLRYGRIDEISPFRLPKNPTEPYKRCLHFTNNKQCRCRMSDNSNYCTIHSKIYEENNIDNGAYSLIKNIK